MILWILFAAAGFWWITYLVQGHETMALVTAIMLTITWILYLMRTWGRRRDPR